MCWHSLQEVMISERRSFVRSFVRRRCLRAERSSFVVRRSSFVVRRSSYVVVVRRCRRRSSSSSSFFGLWSLVFAPSLLRSPVVCCLLFVVLWLARSLACAFLCVLVRPFLRTCLCFAASIAIQAASPFEIVNERASQRASQRAGGCSVDCSLIDVHACDLLGCSLLLSLCLSLCLFACLRVFRPVSQHTSMTELLC